MLLGFKEFRLVVAFETGEDSYDLLLEGENQGDGENALKLGRTWQMNKLYLGTKGQVWASLI